MTFPAYPQYKDSGIESLGEIPSHWDVTRLPYVIFENNAGEVIDKNFWGDGSELLYTCAKQPLLSDFRDFPARKRIGANDLLLTRNGTPYVHLPSEGAIYSNVVQRVSLIPGIDRKFMRSALDVATRDLVGYGVSIASFNYEMWAALRIPLPDYEEQTQIARFLDHETARIDALIEEQQRLIELLKEKRQAVISHAVTKGLDPTVPMKDSGVEWLGEVPAHWEITQVKRRCDLITDGAHISPETENGVYCFVSTRDVSDEGIDFEGCLRTSADSYEYLVRTGCQPEVGDVLFSKDGTIGRTIVVGEGSPEFVVASSLIIIRPSREELLPSYLDFLCQSWVVSQQVDGFVKGAGLPRLSIQNLTKVVGVFPPLEEQVLIADFLQVQSVTARQLTSEALRTMELLKERRSALISAAVTGKIDVRGWQPPASTQTPEFEVAEAH